jgi:anti-anti-sigma factor
MSWALRGHPGSAELACYEQLVQQVYDGGGVTGICQYDRRLFGPAAAAGLAGPHPLWVEPDSVHDDGTLRIAPTFQPWGLRVAGTVDVTTGPELATALRECAARAAGDVYLDMSELAFIDVDGLRMLVATAAELDGGRLRVVNLAPTLRRVVGLVGWDRAPGLEFVPEAACA